MEINEIVKEWKEKYKYTDEQIKLRSAVESIVSMMSRDDTMYYCYTLVAGAGDDRFRYFCTHVIFEDDNLNISEADVSWILKGESRICRENKEKPGTYMTGADFAFLIFVVILLHLHLKDILKVYFTVNALYVEDVIINHFGVHNDLIELDAIAERYKNKHRIADEAKELIEEGYTLEKIVKEVFEECGDIDSNGGFADITMNDRMELYMYEK